MITAAGLGTFWGSGEPYHDEFITNYFRQTIADAKNNASVLLSQIPSTTENISGKYCIYPVKYGRNVNAFNFVGDGGKLPDPGAAEAAHYNFRAPTMFARTLIDGQILRYADEDRTRYVEALSDNMEQLEDDMEVELNRMMFNDGSGRLCQLNGAPGGGTTITVQVNQGIESPSTSDSRATAFLNVGDRIAFITAAGVVEDVDTVASITSETVFEVDSGVTATDGSWLVRCSFADSTPARKDTAFRREPRGLEAILSDGEPLDGTGISGSQQAGSDEYVATSGMGFQGVTISHQFNKGIVLGNSGVKRDPTEQLFQRVFEASKEQNNAEIDLVLSKPGVQLAYGETLIGDKRYNNTTTLNGGYTALTVCGKNWVTDRMAWGNRAYCLALSDGGFQQYVVEQFRPLDYKGAHWYRVQDEDKYHAAWVSAWTVGVDVRDRCGINLVDLNSVDTGAAWTY